MPLKQCLQDLGYENSKRCTTYPIIDAPENLFSLPQSCSDVNNVCENYLGPVVNGSEWKSVGSNRCQRTSYKGDPGYCCISNSSTYINPTPCFDTIGYTCNINNRSNVNTSCYLPIIGYCSSAINIETMENNWSNLYPKCLYTLDYWYTGTTTPFTVTGGYPIPASIYNNTEGLSSASDMMVQFNRLYNNWGYRLGAPKGSSTYNDIEENIYSICSTSPGSCSDMLTEYCTGISSQDITSNPNLLRWCGCHMPDQEYSRYVNQYQLSKECTPLCNRLGNIPLTTPDKTTNRKCKTDNCLIDNVSISLLNSVISGGINFSQLCGGCGENGSCTCIMDGMTLTTVNSNVQGAINISQECGSTICYQDNPNLSGPNQVSIDCKQDFPKPESTVSNVSSPYDNLFPYIWIGLIILAILLLIVIWRGRDPIPSKPSPAKLPVSNLYF
jgi:hypothetical protein